MIRYIIAAVVGCIYVVGSMWAVRSQGQAYRDGLIKTRLAARQIEPPSVPLPDAKDNKPPAVARAEITTPRPQPTTTPKPAMEHAEVSAPTHASESLTPPPPVTDVARKSVVKPLHAGRKPGEPAKLTTTPAKLVNKNSFWAQPQFTKVWDISSLNPEDERRLGAELHELIVQFNPLVDDGPWLARVEDAADPFIKTLGRKEINYHYFILNSDEVNAFSHPGGYIYVSRGLVDLIEKDDDSALQFAVGHEIAHVDLRHAIKCLQDPDLKNMPMGTLQKLFGLIIPAGYLESDRVGHEVIHEFEADEWVARRMQQIERTRREILKFLQKLEGYAENHGFVNGHMKPRDNFSPLDNHYRAITAARKRLKHLKEFMEIGAKKAK